jgi:hypothetical protein
LVELDKNGWTRLHAEVLVLVLRMTGTRSAILRPTQSDRAREAVQQAFERYLRVRPAGVDTVDALRRYLVGAARSALSNEKDAHAARRTHEKAAMTEREAVDGSAARSMEDDVIESFEEQENRERAGRIVARLRQALAGDAVALATIDCIERGETEPAEQARLLGQAVEEIYAARKRRKRALDRILAEERAGCAEERRDVATNR